jgi:putative transposase
LGIKPAIQQNTPVTDKPLSYAGYRFPPDVISYAVWLYYRFPLSLRMVEELLAARGIALTHETVRRWAVEFGLGIARRIRSTALARGDKWHLDEVVATINGKKHWLWRAVASTVRCSTYWYRAAATGMRSGASCVNYSRGTGAHRVS